MKRTIRIILCAAAVVLATVSCQKSIEPVNPIEEGKGTIDIRVNGLMGEYTQADGTKADLVNTVRVSWKGGETVYVYDGTHCLGSLAASLEGTEDRYAVLSTDDTHIVSTPGTGTEKLTLVYSPLLTEAPSVSNGAISISLASQSSGKAPFVAYATLDYTGTTITDVVVPFQFATSVIKVNCTGLKANTAITSAKLRNVNTACKLTLSGAGVQNVSGDVNGTITRTGDEYFANTKINDEGEAVFQIAVPKLETASGARVLTVAQSSDKAIDKKFTTKSLNPATSINTVCQLVGLPVGALEGEFSVQDGAGQPVKQVHFSKGNLTYDVNASTNKWKFYEHQYDCATGYDPNLISLFTWGYNATKSIVPNGTASDNVSRSSGNLSQTEDWGCKIGDGNTWRTLTKEEWQYLFNTRTVNGGQGAGKSYSINITYGGKMGLVLYPDNYSGSTLTSGIDYTDANFPADCVFLPAAGDRNGSDVRKVGVYGSYWSSTARNSSYAYCVYFLSDHVYPGNNDLRYYGYSVRLITESK